MASEPNDGHDGVWSDERVVFDDVAPAIVCRSTPMGVDDAQRLLEEPPPSGLAASALRAGVEVQVGLALLGREIPGDPVAGDLA